MAVIYNPMDMTYEVDGTKISKEAFEDTPTAWWPPTTSISTGAFPTPISALGALAISQRDKIIREIVDDGYWVKATGSRVTKNGWTSESDWDYVVLDPDRTLDKKLIGSGEWHLGGSGTGEEFNSWKQKDVNLILVDKEDIWKKYVIATNLIKALNSKTKEERIKVFDSVFGKDKNAQAVDFEECPF